MYCTKQSHCQLSVNKVSRIFPVTRKQEYDQLYSLKVDNTTAFTIDDQFSANLSWKGRTEYPKYGIHIL